MHKKNREKGCEYKDYKKTIIAKFLPTEDRKKRNMLIICQSNVCKKAKNRHCFTFSDETRNKLFKASGICRGIWKRFIFLHL